jgi:hypothetical protein
MSREVVRKRGVPRWAKISRRFAPDVEWKTPLHPLRFRATFYIDGAQAREELD